MKLWNNKITETVILVPLITFFAIAGYYFVDAYKSYERIDTAKEQMHYITLLEDLLRSYDEERSATGVYLGSHGHTDFNPLNQVWQESEKKKAALFIFLSSHPQYKKDAQQIMDALKTQEKNRAKVTLLNTDYRKLYFTSKSNLGNLILKEIENNKIDYLHTDNRGLLDTLKLFTTHKEAIASERGITFYFMARAKPISAEELALWDPLIGKDTTSDYTKISQKAIRNELDTLFNTSLYQNRTKAINTDRLKIIIGCEQGRFDVDLQEWHKLINSKISTLNQAIDLLGLHIKSSFETQVQQEKKVISIAALIMFIILVLTWVMHTIFAKMAQDTRHLQDALKTIEQEGSEEIEEQLREMLYREDKAEIYQFLARTILESKESKRLADEANATKSKFLANMSHEIRTPLNGIVGFTGLLKTTELDSEQQEFIEIIEKSSENLLSVINDILDLSKIENNKIEIEMTAFDPIEEFESGIESYGAKAAEKNITLGLYIDPDLDNDLLGDPTRIKQVVVNLISNAVKFTPEGGEIDVIIEKVASKDNNITVRFAVKDSGIGITPAQKSKIFEAFSQADTSTNRKFGGTGLGLTISRTLVELMGGKLDLESEEGKGTTFFFTLSFEEMPSLEMHKHYEVLNVGHLLPKEATHAPSDNYTSTYIASINKLNYEYDNVEILLELQQDQQPDLLFVNYAHINDDILKRLITLKSKIVLITTLREKNHLDTLELSLNKILYAPINFSKIKKIIATLSNEEMKAEIKDDLTQFKDLHALVAEDNVINQKLIKRSLENIGIEVTLADNGAIAYEKRQQKNNFDVIFMDIQMPIMDGIEATKAIVTYEKEYNLKHIPIIALTANALKGDKEYFLSQGLDQYVSKPMELKVIISVLKYYFNNKVHIPEETLATPELAPAKETIEELLLKPEEEIIEASRKLEIDIILYKKSQSEAKIFAAILKKIGYSVDIANSLEDFEDVLDTKQYRYALLDRSASHLENSKLSKKLKEHNILSILFVQDIQTIRPMDRRDFTHVVLNVADLQLLRYHMVKLTLLKNDKFSTEAL